MKTARYRNAVVALSTLLIASGCSNMHILEAENAELSKRVTELEQIEKKHSTAEKENVQLQQELAAIRSDLTQRLEEQIKKNDVLLEKIKSLTVVTLGEASAFGSGVADLTSAGVTIIQEIAKTLEEYPEYSVRVEGHTDDVPVGARLKPRYPSNWELSAARAGSVVRYMIYGLNIAPDRLAATGYAHYRPVALNTTEEGRIKNRRIRIVVFKEAL